MNTRLIIDGNAVYEIDEDCLACRGRRTGCRRCVRTGFPHPGTKHAFTEIGTCQ